MEIINEGPAEDHRIRALARLVTTLQKSTPTDIIDLVQPLELVGQTSSKEAQSTARNALKIAEECGLIVENQDHLLELLVSPEQVETMSAFQNYMRGAILGVTEEGKSNYLLNLFSAWYAVQDERVFAELLRIGYDGPFNDQMFPDASGRPFNSTKFTTWRRWANFLGLGWPLRVGAREILVPDATERIEPLLPLLFQERLRLLFGQFMERLARLCPELDGGKLFTHCWQASRGAEDHGKRLSLMLSTALRTLDGLNIIHLIHQADALETWQLYPAQGSQHQQVTHIELAGA